MLDNWHFSKKQLMESVTAHQLNVSFHFIDNYTRILMRIVLLPFLQSVTISSEDDLLTSLTLMNAAVERSGAVDSYWDYVETDLRLTSQTPSQVPNSAFHLLNAASQLYRPHSSLSLHSGDKVESYRLLNMDVDTAYFIRSIEHIWRVMIQSMSKMRCAALSLEL